MLKEFEGVNYEELKRKWFDEGKDLTIEEISGLFGLIEAKEDRLKAIKEIVSK